MLAYDATPDSDHVAEVIPGRPVSAQCGPCAVTVMPRSDVVVCTPAGVLVMDQAHAWQLGRALQDLHTAVLIAAGSAP